MAFPAGAALLSDFAGANGSLKSVAPFGAEGINTSSFVLERIGEQLGTSSSGSGREAAKSGPDVFRYITVKTQPATNEGYIFFSARATTGGNWNGYGFIFIRTGASTWVNQVRKYTSGSSSVLGANNTTVINVGDRVGFSVEGKKLKLWREASGSGTWTLLAEREDATYTAEGYVGIEITTNGRYDDYSGATVSGSEKKEGTAKAEGGGATTAAGTTDRSGTSLAQGGGATSGSGSTKRPATALAQGGGGTTSSGSSKRQSSSLTQGGGDATTSGAKRVMANVIVEGGGAILTITVTARKGAAQIEGGGADTAQGTGDHAGAATVAGGGTSSSAGVTKRQGPAAVQGGGDVVAAGEGEEEHGEGEGSAEVSGGGSVSASGSTIRIGASLTSGGGLTVANGAHIASGSATISGGGQAALAGAKHARGAALGLGGGDAHSEGSGSEVVAGSATASGGGAATASGISVRSGEAMVLGGGSVRVVGSGNQIIWYEGEVQPVERWWLNTPSEWTSPDCDHEHVVIPLESPDQAPLTTSGMTTLHCVECDCSWWESLTNIKGSPFAVA